MRMLSGSAAAALPKAQIAVGWTAEPRVGGEDPAPVLTKLDIERLDLAGDAVLHQLAEALCRAADHMVIADEEPAPSRLRVCQQVADALEPGCASRLLD